MTILFGQENHSDEVVNNTNSSIVISPDTTILPTDLKQLFLYRYDDPSYIRIYPGNTIRLNNLEPGYYRLLVLLKKNRYYISDSLKANEGGLTFYRLHANKIIVKDSTSLALGAAILTWRNDWERQLNYDATVDFTSAFNNQYLDTSSLDHWVRGIVTDGKNPLPGVMIQLKGTRHAVATDKEGRFSLSVTKNGILYIKYVGYESQALSLKNQDFFDIKLKTSSAALNEVLVVGYSIQKRESFTAASMVTISGTLAGRVAGVTIRGNNSLGNEKPLIIMDGIPYEGNMADLDPKLIKSMSVLKDAAATAIYGTRGANGVILVTTSKVSGLSAAAGEDLPGAANSLRSNFHDDAFWQPRLRTNEKGEAAFNVTFPDDITNWKTYALAFTDQQQTGSATVQIKSYKPISAILSLPAFAVAGDSINVIGKVLNYGKDSATVNRHFYTDDHLVLNGNIGVQNSRMDTFPIIVKQADSISFKYTISGSYDYFDGEYRAIPVFEQGVKETTGNFTALARDTAFTLTLPDDTGAVHIYASTGMLPVLLDEVDYLQRYEYLCNEQLASKLIGLLLEKKARKYLEQPFKHDRKITELLRKLEQNKNNDGGWGWWDKSNSVYWISYHVTQALIMAQQEGYKPSLDKTGLISYYVFLLNAADNTDKITLLETLHLLDAKVNYPAYLDTIKTAKGNTYDQFRLLYLKQRTGIHVTTDSLLAKRQVTMLGNSYWGEESYHLFNNNSVQLTLLAYKILRTEGRHEDLLRNIRNWFMENRHNGNWRNTYESAAILATIMPDVLQASQQLPATLTINNQHITTFPYSHILPAGTPLQISKQGGATVYFTAWQQYWNRTPQKVNKQFSVNSKFLQNGSTADHLVAGRVVTMEVTVAVKADADYVMVEIPVPAGCSYDSKNSSWLNNEIHREYFKNKVSIFCNNLNKGVHTFTISLMPRYSGEYHINPAKAEMMYFPVFFGREGMKEVIISGK